jgi:hypothetical protein
MVQKRVSMYSMRHQHTIPLISKPQLKAHNRVSHREAVSRHVRHAHRSVVRMVSSLQLVAQDGDAFARRRK